jgi:hypothetical protein
MNTLYIQMEHCYCNQMITDVYCTGTGLPWPVCTGSRQAAISWTSKELNDGAMFTGGVRGNRQQTGRI